MKKKNNKKSRNKKKTIKLTYNDTCSLDNADTEKLLSKSLFEKAVSLSDIKTELDIKDFTSIRISEVSTKFKKSKNVEQEATNITKNLYYIKDGKKLDTYLQKFITDDKYQTINISLVKEDILKTNEINEKHWFLFEEYIFDQIIKSFDQIQTFLIDELGLSLSTCKAETEIISNNSIYNLKRMHSKIYTQK